MRTLSKRLSLEREKIDQTRFYDVKEGIGLLKSTASANFIESVEAHISLNLDPKYADQQLRTTVILPNGTGRSLKIAVLVNSDKVSEALSFGADIAGSDDLVDNIAKIDFEKGQMVINNSNVSDIVFIKKKINYEKRII